jgi:sigma-B regulation protein RsbU (phosphoserine phosphatase)
VSSDASEASLLGELFDNSPVPLVVTSLIRDRILAVNGRSEEVFGLRGEDVVGGSVIAFYSDPADRQTILTAIRETGRLTNHPLELRHPDGRIVSVLFNSRRIVWYGEPAIIGAFVDLTAQRQAERALAASEARLAEQSRALTSLTERSIASDESSENRVNEILRSAATTLGVARLSVWRLNRDTDEIECMSLYQKTTPVRDGVGTHVPRPVCPAYFAALEAERVIDASDARTDPRTSGFTDGYLIPNGIGAMLDVPLRQAGGTLGVLCAEHVGGARTWTVDEQNFAISVANLLAAAGADSERRHAIARLEESEARANQAREAAEKNRDRLDHELASAGEMQRMILPRSLPADPRLRFAATYQTSRHAGGDYYDVIQIDRDRFALVVIDVSGHGARAAIVMAMIRAVIHSSPMEDPVAVLQHLNRHFEFLWDTSMFATAIVAVLDASSRMLRVASAGHMPPLLIRETQVTEMPVESAPLLLWNEIADPPVREIRLEAGDRVVLYTDGITDRCGPNDSRFDLERVTNSFARNSGMEMKAMLAELDRELEAFACTHEPDDDQTVLAVQIIS